MTFLDILKNRRTYYSINKNLPVSEDAIIAVVEKATALTPDAFDMKSARAVVVTGDKQDQLWDTIYDVFEGKVDRAKIDSFKNGYGTILYYSDTETVKALQETYPLYADNFPVWSSQANGMLQLAIWTSLRELNVGASLQHYNPVIDEAVRTLLDLPSTWQLIAQMPFGGIGQEPDAKAEEDISLRVKVIK